MNRILSLLLLALLPSLAWSQDVVPVACCGAQEVAQDDSKFVTDDKGNKYPLGRVAPSKERLKAAHAASWQKHGHNITMLAARAVPDAYDSESFGIVPPIKDQSSCGSCHIFSAFGVATSAQIKAGNWKNSSDGYAEQWALDCRRELGGCNGGWEWDDCQVLLKGGPLESEYATYRAQASTCKTVKQLYKISEMGMCSQGDGVAKTADMQACLVQYGPISVAVAADNAFANYSGGLFNGSGSRSINHAVIVTGWKTVSGVVYWKLRNSWSRSWGESGYMWIKAGANQVGDSSFWCRAEPINPPPPPLAIPEITSPLTSNAVTGQLWSYQITATNSPTSYATPGNSFIVSATGLVSGTVKTAGSYNVPITATNASGTGTATLALTVTDKPVPPTPTTVIGSGKLANGQAFEMVAPGTSVEHEKLKAWKAAIIKAIQDSPPPQAHKLAPMPKETSQIPVQDVIRILERVDEIGRRVDAMAGRETQTAGR